MPNVTPKRPGDNAYPRYQRADLYTTSIEVTKGRLYTMNVAGKLSEQPGTGVSDAFSGSGHKVKSGNDWNNGIFQATVSGGADGDRVACFAAGTRVIMEAGENGLRRGQRVQMTGDGKLVKLDVYSASNNDQANRVVGRIFDFYGGIPDSGVDSADKYGSGGDVLVTDTTKDDKKYLIVELGVN